MEEYSLLKAVETIFDRYDTSAKGCLTKEETEEFIKDTLALEDNETFIPEEFQELFQAFDVHGNGFVKKKMMLDYVIGYWKE